MNMRGLITKDSLIVIGISFLLTKFKANMEKNEKFNRVKGSVSDVTVLYGSPWNEKISRLASKRISR